MNGRHTSHKPVAFNVFCVPDIYQWYGELKQLAQFLHSIVPNRHIEHHSPNHLFDLLEICWSLITKGKGMLTKDC
jgi:hypothetical protein